MSSLSKKLFIAGIALLLTTFAEAQKSKKRTSDYVITPKGDTMICIITIPMLGKNTYTTMTDTPRVLKPDEVKEYYVRSKNERYRSVLRPGETKPVFLKVLEAGKINLYEDLTANTAKDTYNATWYITKNPGKLVELRGNKLSPGKGQKNELQEMLMDNKDVYDAYVNDKKFTFDEARSFIHLYNTGEWQQGWGKTYAH